MDSMDFQRKIEYFYYIRERKLMEIEQINERSNNIGNKQSNIKAINFPEDIDSFVSGLITADQLEEIKKRKQAQRRKLLKERSKK